MNKKEILIDKLIQLGLYKDKKGRHLYELSLQELEQLRETLTIQTN
ncbi:Fur-regulated basic protein FbpA [Bacillus cereus]|nr:Fur-regulated basic protein FbpA [Bacillus cereus]